MDRIEKNHADLDFESVDFKNGHWTCGCGGHPLENNEWAISHVSDDLIETRYKMPKCINEMLLRRYRNGAAEKLREIQSALGI